ncbi:MAG: uracil-DNA glycosylase family protein [Candidatus Dormibacteria bacterium]
MTARKGDGPEGAKIMLVGGCYSDEDLSRRTPFQGYPGILLNQILHDAKIMRSECYTSNLINDRPPYGDMGKWITRKKKDVTPAHIPFRDAWVLPNILEGYESLKEEIATVNPNVIVAFGTPAMWALTGEDSVMKWRGSQMLDEAGRKVIPCHHPSEIIAQPELRPITINDLKRVAKEKATKEYTNIPQWNFILRPDLQTVLSTLQDLTDQAAIAPIWVEFDLETSPHHITCAGISWSLVDAMCIPITTTGNKDGYWSLDEEAIVVHALYRFLTNPNIWVRGQNLLYDCQHTYRHWHFVPNVKQDTMISHHSMFCGMKKSLAFQASMYCDYYSYWKEMHHDDSNKAGS